MNERELAEICQRHDWSSSDRRCSKPLFLWAASRKSGPQLAAKTPPAAIISLELLPPIASKVFGSVNLLTRLRI